MRPTTAREQPRPRSAAHPSAPGLSVVEIEVGSRCNRRCGYCPVSLNPRPNLPVKMSDEVFNAIVNQLAQVGFAGRLSYHLYNEPLLRKDLARLVAIVDEQLPDALQVLNTNGDLLDDRRYTKLLDAGIDYFYVTRHGPGDLPERPFQTVQSWQDLTLTNRGGTIIDLPEANDQIRHTPCHAPAEMLIVSVTGDVVLCYEDADRDHVMGNVLDTPLWDIWSNRRMTYLRERLAAGDRSVSDMCTSCTNVSHAQPGLSILEPTFLRENGLSQRPDAAAVLKQRARAARRDRAEGV